MSYSLVENNLEFNPILAPSFLNSSNASFPLSSPLLPAVLFRLLELLDLNKLEEKMLKLLAANPPDGPPGVFTPEEWEGGEVSCEDNLGSMSR